MTLKLIRYYVKKKKKNEMLIHNRIIKSII